jgi:hypothetical protein
MVVWESFLPLTLSLAMIRFAAFILLANSRSHTNRKYPRALAGFQEKGGRRAGEEVMKKIKVDEWSGSAAVWLMDW